jgi:hypothetical protein
MAGNILGIIIFIIIIIVLISRWWWGQRRWRWLFSGSGIAPFLLGSMLGSSGRGGWGGGGGGGWSGGDGAWEDSAEAAAVVVAREEVGKQDKTLKQRLGFSLNENGIVDMQEKLNLN